MVIVPTPARSNAFRTGNNPNPIVGQQHLRTSLGVRPSLEAEVVSLVAVSLLLAGAIGTAGAVVEGAVVEGAVSLLVHGAALQNISVAAGEQKRTVRLSVSFELK